MSRLKTITLGLTDSARPRRRDRVAVTCCRAVSPWRVPCASLRRVAALSAHADRS